MLLRRIALAMTAATAVACSLVYPLDGYSGADDANGDATGADALVVDVSIDAGPGMDAASEADAADGDTRSNVLETDSFEQGCPGWDLSGATAVRDVGRTGNGCKLCANTLGSAMQIERAVPGGEAGKRYRLEVWVRRAGTGTTPATWTLSLQSEISGSNARDEASGALSPTWTRVAIEHTGVPTISAVVMVIGASPVSPGDCMLIDDLVLTKL